MAIGKLPVRFCLIDGCHFFSAEPCPIVLLSGHAATIDS
jgi:hypothetical protein